MNDKTREQIEAMKNQTIGVEICLLYTSDAADE